MKKYEIFGVEIKTVNEEKGTLEAVFSTQNEDRHGDVVMQDGWDLKNFKKNPVILNSHNYGDATEVIGKAINPKVVDGKLEGKIEFAVNQSEKAKTIFNLYAGGFLKAFSVGFIPLEFDEKDYSKITKAELLEVSAVSVPANAMALAKAKGIDVSVLEKENESNTNNEDEKDNGEITKDKGDSGKDERKKDNETIEPNKRVSSRAKEFENWEDADNEVRLKLRDIDHFNEGTFEKITYKAISPVINGIVALPIGETRKVLQMLIFPKIEGWTLDDAKKYWSVNQEDIINWKKSLARKLDKKEFVKFAEKTERQEENLLKVAKSVIDEMNKDPEMKKFERNRKINQAVRNLLKAKEL